MAIQFNKSTAAREADVPPATRETTGGGSNPRQSQAGRRDGKGLGNGEISASPVVSSFINTTNTGLKVKMPDSVHIFLPGETIEFIEKDLGTDGAQKELDRRARRAAKKQKVSRESDQIKRYGDVAQKVKIESYIVVNPNNPKKQYQFRLSSIEEARAYFRKRFKEDIDLSHVKERSGCVVLPNGHVFSRRDMIKYVPKLP